MLKTVMRSGLLVFIACLAWPAQGAVPAGSNRPDPMAATSSPAARQEAVQSIPFEKLTPAARSQVSSVLSNVTVFRRLPIRAVGCDPDLYLFLVRHPDVIVDIWRVLGLAQIELRQTGPDTFTAAELEGTKATMQFLYHSHDTHVLYGEWSYTGRVLPRVIQGKCLAILRSGYVRETDGRYYVTSRLDAFLSVDPGAVELLTRTLHPLVVKNADANFVQTVAFVGSLSRTAEVNSRGMQRLAAKLTRVSPEVRQELAEMVATVAERAPAKPTAKASPAAARVATRSTTEER